MTNRLVDTHEGVIARLKKDPEFYKAYRQVEPYQVLVGEMVQRRKTLGITQKELAKRIGTSQGNISRIETGEHNIRFNTLIKIAEALESELCLALEPFEDYTYDTIFEGSVSSKTVLDNVKSNVEVVLSITQ